jgi:hypothetical protein
MLLISDFQTIGNRKKRGKESLMRKGMWDRGEEQSVQEIGTDVERKLGRNLRAAGQTEVK